VLVCVHSLIQGAGEVAHRETTGSPLPAHLTNPQRGKDVLTFKGLKALSLLGRQPILPCPSGEDREAKGL